VNNGMNKAGRKRSWPFLRYYLYICLEWQSSNSFRAGMKQGCYPLDN